MNMTISPGLSGTAYSSQLSTSDNPQNPDEATLTEAQKAAAQAAATAEAGGLSDQILRKLAGSLQTLNAGLTSLSDENGATAISLPTVAAPTDMGALSTADLLQIIRAEVAKTTALLTSATIEAIKAQKDTIEAKRAENTAKIQESIAAAEKAAEKAEKAKSLSLALKIFGGLAIGVMLVLGAVTGGATAVIAIAMAAMFVTMTCMTEIKNGDGKTGMDLFGESMAKTIARHQKDLSPEEAAKRGAEAAQYFMMAVQLVVCIACIAVAWSAAASTIGQMVAKVPGMVSNSLPNLAMGATYVGAATEMAKGGATIAQGVIALEAAEYQYEADMAKAEVTRLKALIKMLETVLKGDTEFIKLLMELQAKLDSAVAEIVTAETASNEATDLNNPMMG